MGITKKTQLLIFLTFKYFNKCIPLSFLPSSSTNQFIYKHFQHIFISETQGQSNSVKVKHWLGMLSQHLHHKYMKRIHLNLNIQCHCQFCFWRFNLYHSLEEINYFIVASTYAVYIWGNNCPSSMLSYLIDGNGYETRQTSKGLTKEQTLILSRTSTLHNHLFYSRLIDQIETFSLAHYPICAETFLFCAGSQLKKVNKKIEQWVS